MNKTRPHDQAFPSDVGGVPVEGLTKREWFAGMALSGLLATEAWGDACNKHMVSEWAVSHADSLMEALNE